MPEQPHPHPTDHSTSSQLQSIDVQLAAYDRRHAAVVDALLDVRTRAQQMRTRRRLIEQRMQIIGDKFARRCGPLSIAEQNMLAQLERMDSGYKQMNAAIKQISIDVGRLNVDVQRSRRNAGRATTPRLLALDKSLLNVEKLVDTARTLRADIDWIHQTTMSDDEK